MALEQAPFDVVTSDMRMPGMDGTQFLKEVQQPTRRPSYYPANLIKSRSTGLSVPRIYAWRSTARAHS
jgi:CheY-like chemotaxis protein